MKSTLTTRVIQLTASARQLAAMVSAPALAMSVRASVIAVQAAVGRFLKILDLFDVVGVTDTARVQLQKPLREALALLSQVSRHLSKGRSDNAQVTDRLYKDAAKSLTEAAAWLDTEQRTFAKVLTDTASLLDAHRYQMARPLNDAWKATDTPALNLHRPAADALRMVSVATAQLGKNLTDAVGFLEQTHRLMEKSLFDVIAVTDDFDGAASLEDDQEMTFVKTRTDQSAFSDDFYRMAQFARNFADPALLSDFTRRAEGKALTDAFAFTESMARGAEKPLSDLSSFGDAHQWGLERPAADTAQVSDTAARTFGKEAHDSAGIVDITQKAGGKALTDAAPFSDSTFLAVTYVLNHIAKAIDEQEIQVVKSRTDAAAINDLFSRQVGFRRTPEDSLAMIEDSQKQGGKALSDSPRFEDQVTRAAQRGTSDVFRLSDRRAQTFGKTRTEQATLTDTGSLRSQGYCDFSYFAEDYVGTSRTF